MKNCATNIFHKTTKKITEQGVFHKNTPSARRFFHKTAAKPLFWFHHEENTSFYMRAERCEV